MNIQERREKIRETEKLLQEIEGQKETVEKILWGQWGFVMIDTDTSRTRTIRIGNGNYIKGMVVDDEEIPSLIDALQELQEETQ